MKKHYPWLWFDADGTLFDYNRAEHTALRESLHLQGLPFDDNYLELYQGINQKLWAALERGEIKPDVLRVKRFDLFLEAIQRTGSPEALSETYIQQLGLCTDLIDGALEVLTALRKTSRFALITNGLSVVQRSRLARSQIKDFFEAVIISEEIGAAKPHAAFFETAFARTGNPLKGDVLVIGDSLSSDMRGGADYGLDTCWFNPNGEAKPTMFKVTYEIRELKELLDLID
jgi:YjjG family noncanonical pyrimidine nucleotidase